MREKNIRDNLLVTIASRAAYMDISGDITLPTGSYGEDKLTDFAVEIADKWINHQEECGDVFDLYIEEELVNKFGKSEKESFPAGFRFA